MELEGVLDSQRQNELIPNIANKVQIHISLGNGKQCTKTFEIILEHSASQQATLRGAMEIVVCMQQKHREFRKLFNFLAI